MRCHLIGINLVLSSFVTLGTFVLGLFVYWAHMMYIDFPMTPVRGARMSVVMVPFCVSIVWFLHAWGALKRARQQEAERSGAE